MSCIPDEKVCRYKGKNISLKKFEHRKKLRESCMLLNERKAAKKVQKSVPPMIEDRRIVDISVLAKNLKCLVCNQILSLSCIENEIRRGLASLFEVRCHTCLAVRTVPTSGHSYSDSYVRRKIYDVNSRAVLGFIHAGMGPMHFSKLVSSMNIPCMDNEMFKRYERIVGPAIEFMAKSSCIDAAEK